MSLFTAIQSSFAPASGGGVVSDPDAQAFITVAGTSNPIHTAALDDLVIGLKADGLWAAKLQAIYPMVGGSAGAHKWNLRNPLDTDGAFRIIYAGGWTHSANGALPNGTTASGDTRFTPSVNATIQDTHLSVYLRTNTAGNKIDIGAYTSGAETLWAIYARTASDLMEADSYNYQATFGQLQTANADSRGHFIENRTASNVHNAWKNGTKLATNAFSSLALPTTNVFLAAAQAGVIFSDREIAFATIGKGLSDADALALYNRIQTFQTALGRAV